MGFTEGSTALRFSSKAFANQLNPKTLKNLPSPRLPCLQSTWEALSPAMPTT